MSETKNAKENETDQESVSNKQIETKQSSGQIKYDIVEEGKPVLAIDDKVLPVILRAIATGHISYPFDPTVINNILIGLSGAFDEEAILKALYETRNETIHRVPDKTAAERIAEIVNLVKNSQTRIIPLLINEEPLTPQTLALAFTALTEFTTKLWLIAKHRFADLIEYTQTHDVRFANEAGSTIAWVTYNSPFSFGLQVDKLVPDIADAVITIVDGLSQRRAKRERLEIDNQIALNAVKTAEEQLKQQQEMAEFEREKQEISLEKQRLNNEKIRQVLVEQRLELQMKQIEQALEFAGKAVDIVHPNADPEMRPVLIQTLVNSILQIDSVKGLQLALPNPSNIKTTTKEDTVR